MNVHTQSNTSKPESKTSKGKKLGPPLIILCLFAFVILSRHEPVNTIDCTPDVIASKPDVIMLGAWWCRYCYQAKRYFQKNNINYCEYDMENTDTGRRLYRENGGGAVPILLIGEYRLNGYSEQQIETALTALNKSTYNIQ